MTVSKASVFWRYDSFENEVNLHTLCPMCSILTPQWINLFFFFLVHLVFQSCSSNIAKSTHWIQDMLIFLCTTLFGSSFFFFGVHSLSLYDRICSIGSTEQPCEWNSGNNWWQIGSYWIAKERIYFGIGIKRKGTQTNWMKHEEKLKWNWMKRLLSKQIPETRTKSFAAIKL